MGQSERLYAGKHPAPRAVGGPWWESPWGVGAGRGIAPSPYKPDRGRKQSPDPSLAKSGWFSWEMLTEMLH